MNVYARVRSNIRDSAEGFLIDDNYFLGCLYPDKLRGISEINLEEDFLRGHLLRKVSITHASLAMF